MMKYNVKMVSLKEGLKRFLPNKNKHVRIFQPFNSNAVQSPPYIIIDEGKTGRAERNGKVIRRFKGKDCDRQIDEFLRKNNLIFD